MSFCSRKVGHQCCFAVKELATILPIQSLLGTTFFIAYSNCNLLATTEYSFLFIAVPQTNYLNHHMNGLTPGCLAAQTLQFNHFRGEQLSPDYDYC